MERSEFQNRVLREVASMADAWSQDRLMRKHMEGAKCLAAQILIDYPTVDGKAAEAMVNQAIGRVAANAA